MGDDLRFDGDRVVKRVASAAAARALRDRTRRLVAAGVPTPAASAGPAPDEVAFPRLPGESGLAALARTGGGGLADLLRPLAALHGADLPGLPPFDPALRIRPRLSGGDRAARAALAAGLAAIAGHSARRPLATIHGDFHVGQLIVTPGGAAQVVDLDDLAHGPVEADLGNFAAHLASRPEFNADGAAPALPRWLGAALAAYGRPSDPALALAFAHVALLRRGLKLRDRDGDDSILALAIGVCRAGPGASI